MDSIMKEFEHLVVKLEVVKSATDNFNNTKIIGKGGFGNVYEGEVSQPRGKTKAAFKRLNPYYGQGNPEFWKEIMMLSLYTHENLISLLGFCDEGGEKILVYEHASNGSLDRHLSSTTLTWTQRIRICHDAAKGLCYLHEDKGNHHRVLHRDIKSSNILLDKNWKAKVSDMGLAKVATQFSFLITGTVGTLGYIDPMYLKMGFLTKESDVYSFGVVLFEVLCGRLCFNNSNARSGIMVHMWKQRYEENKLYEIIFKDDLIEALDQSSFEMFSQIAFQCLQDSREKRPKMSDVVEKLNIALKSQELADLTREYQEIVKAVVPPLIYRSIEELKVLLSKGVILNGGKTWLSITEKWEHIEKIYIEACLNHAEIRDDSLNHPSSFPGGRCYEYRGDGFKARVRGQYLTPQISYTVNLVFQYRRQSEVNSYNPLRYKIDGEDETKVFIIYSKYMRQDGWFIAPLYQFTSLHETADLQFEFEYRCTSLLVAGIEFQPIEKKVELQVFEEYQDIVDVASQSLFYTSVDELKQILNKGVYLNGYKTWFSLNDKGEHCHMISMEDCLIPDEDSAPRYESHCFSRFPAGFYQTNKKGFTTHVKTQLLSPSVAYLVNLFFYSSSYSNQEYVDLKYRLRGETKTSNVYLAKERDDELFHMAKLYQFTSDGSIIDLEIIFENCGTDIDGIEGIMFQPLEEQDIKVEQTRDQRNILESFVYDTRRKLSNAYRSFATDSEKEGITISLQETEDWLYEDNDDDSDEPYYTSKLEYLKKLLDPIEKRYKDENARAKVTKAMQTLIEEYRSATELMSRWHKDEVNNECLIAEQWLNGYQQLEGFKNLMGPVRWANVTQEAKEILKWNCKVIMTSKSSSPKHERVDADQRDQCVDQTEQKVKDEIAREKVTKSLRTFIDEYRSATFLLPPRQKDEVNNECLKAEQWLNRYQQQEGFKNMDPIRWVSVTQEAMEKLEGLVPTTCSLIEITCGIKLLNLNFSCRALAC